MRADLHRCSRALRSPLHRHFAPRRACRVPAKDAAQRRLAPARARRGARRGVVEGRVHPHADPGRQRVVRTRGNPRSLSPSRSGRPAEAARGTPTARARHRENLCAEDALAWTARGRPSPRPARTSSDARSRAPPRRLPRTLLPSRSAALEKRRARRRRRLKSRKGNAVEWARTPTGTHYENTGYQSGRHRWVEYADLDNYNATSVPRGRRGAVAPRGRRAWTRRAPPAAPNEVAFLPAVSARSKDANELTAQQHFPKGHFLNKRGIRNWKRYTPWSPP